MRRIFFSVLEINIAVSVIILLLGLLSGKLRKRYGADWMKLAWFLLAVRLLIPYNFSLPFTEIRLFNVPGFEKAENGLQDAGWDQTSLDTNDADMNDSMFQAETTDGHKEEAQSQIGNTSQGSALQDNIPVENTKPAEDVHSPEDTHSVEDMHSAEDTRLSYAAVLVRVWVLGIGICLLYDIFNYLLFYFRYRKNLRVVTDINFRKQILALERKFTGKANIPFYQSRSVSSPMLIGIFRPRLVFPVRQKQWPQTELELIMAHELCHYNRKDLILKLLMTAACCVNWFNPMVFYMKRQFFYDIELSCDGRVLLDRSGWERESYARLMLSFAGKRREASAYSTGFWESKSRMKKRIDYMLDSGRKKKGILSIAVTGLLILCVSLIVSCGYQPKERDMEEIKTQEEQDGEEAEDSRQPVDNPQPEEEMQESTFDYNHEYNEMICCDGNDIYIAREDGIYCLEPGEEKEKLVYGNTYSLRRGMEIDGDSLYFCGSVKRGEKEEATIYRMRLDTLEVEDTLAMFSGHFESLYNISVYEDKLYVASGYEQRIGFELNEEGRIVRQLDESADDFLYREYNDYMELELQRMQAETDEEYWDIVEEQKKRYCAVMDVVSCKKMLNGKQVVSQYKDELLRSIYLEGEDGTYEYLCDSAGYPMLVTETGLYYAAEESGEIWYIDYETKHSRKIYAREGREWAELQLVNYDADYIYVLKSRSIGSDMEGNNVKEIYLMRVPREGGNPQKVYLFKDDLGINYLYRHCGVVSGYMYFEDRETISLDPDTNGMQEANSGLPAGDAVEMTKLAKKFAAAYFQNDVETLRSLLVDDFTGPIDLYSYPEQAGKIEETYIGGLPEADVSIGVCCNVFYEFSGHAETDGALVYLDMQIVKTEQGFKVKWYGLEM